jgi:serine/threonine protein kinase
MAGALGAAHAKGIVHRDLKPENVMLILREGRRELVRQFSDESGLHEISEREEKFDFVKILDFGVAKVHDPDVAEGRVTQAGVVFGTPEYMAPETARVGTADPRTDIYALGVMFYEMLTGTVPFTGGTPVDVMLRLVSEAVVPPRKKAPKLEITDEAERLIMKALSKDPRRRQQSMEELVRELQQCYGSVRYRRAMQAPPQDKEITRPGPIPLQKVKRPNTDPAGSVTTPPGTFALRPNPASTPPSPPPGISWGNQPILLTKRKERSSKDAPAPPTERRKTLPMGLRDAPVSPRSSPRPIAPQITAEIEADFSPTDDDHGIDLDDDDLGHGVDSIDIEEEALTGRVKGR